MTNEPQTPPPPPGYDADEEAFTTFTRGFRSIAGDLDTNALATHTGMPGDTFSRVGNEVGLTEAIRAATQRQIDRVRGLGGNTESMAEAVDNTWSNYRTTEDDHERAIRRAAGDLT